MSEKSFNPLQSLHDERQQGFLVEEEPLANMSRTDSSETNPFLLRGSANASVNIISDDVQPSHSSSGNPPIRDQTMVATNESTTSHNTTGHNIATATATATAPSNSWNNCRNGNGDGTTGRNFVGRTWRASERQADKTQVGRASTKRGNEAASASFQSSESQEITI